MRRNRTTVNGHRPHCSRPSPPTPVTRIHHQRRPFMTFCQTPALVTFFDIRDIFEQSKERLQFPSPSIFHIITKPVSAVSISPASSLPGRPGPTTRQRIDITSTSCRFRPSVVLFRHNSHSSVNVIHRLVTCLLWVCIRYRCPCVTTSSDPRVSNGRDNRLFFFFHHQPVRQLRHCYRHLRTSGTGQFSLSLMNLTWLYHSNQTQP